MARELLGRVGVAACGARSARVGAGSSRDRLGGARERPRARAGGRIRPRAERQSREPAEARARMGRVAPGIGAPASLGARQRTSDAVYWRRTPFTALELAPFSAAPARPRHSRRHFAAVS